MFPTSLLSRSLNLPDRTLALTIVSASSLRDLGEGGPVMVDISNFTAAKILNELPSPSRVEYRYELEPLWLAADLVEKSLELLCSYLGRHLVVLEGRGLGALRPRATANSDRCR